MIADGDHRGDGASSTSAAPGRRSCCDARASGRGVSDAPRPDASACWCCVYMFVPIVRRRADELQRPGQPQHLRVRRRSRCDNWPNPCDDPTACATRVVLSIQIGLLATLGRDVLGTLMAFALVRHRFRGRSAANLLIFLPMATPEIVMGSSLLALFVAAGFAGQLGFWTILIAHIMFCLSFVVVTVKARLAGMDTRLEQAAMDLYANEWQTFWRVTLPAGASPASSAPRCWRSRCPSTTSSSPTSTPASGDVPDVRLGRRPAGYPAADQRGRHDDVPGCRVRAGRRVARSQPLSAAAPGGGDAR